MKEQVEGFGNVSEQPKEGMVGCDLTALEELVDSTDVAAIARGRKAAQLRLRALIDGGEVKGRG
jgi:hypothetical protein